MACRNVVGRERYRWRSVGSAVLRREIAEIKKPACAGFFILVNAGKLAYLARDSGSSSRILPSISFRTRGLATTMLPEFS